jgi:adenine-specific DNA-methyltransferase
LDTESRWIIDTAYAIQAIPGEDYDLASLAAILNSKILTMYLKEFGTSLRGGYFRMKTSYLSPFPLPRAKPAQRQLAALSKLTYQMQDRLRPSESRRTAHERTALERQIAAVDRQIDQLVYELYGLSDAEIALVESATAPAAGAAAGDAGDDA